MALHLPAALDGSSARLIAAARAVERASYVPATSGKTTVRLATAARDALQARAYPLALAVLADLDGMYETLTEGTDTDVVAAELIRERANDLSRLVAREAKLDEPAVPAAVEPARIEGDAA